MLSMEETPGEKTPSCANMTQPQPQPHGLCVYCFKIPQLYQLDQPVLDEITLFRIIENAFIK